MVIVVSGGIGRAGVGGKAWVYLQYLLGLRQLGHDVYYLEDCGEESWVYNWETQEVTTDLACPTAYVQACLEPFGLQDRWIYRAGERSEGMALAEFLERCREASLLIVHADPLSLWREEYRWPGRRIFIDVDPGFTQISVANGHPDLEAPLAHCERLFTVGQRFGANDCPIPQLGREWHRVLAPVFLPDWPVAPDDQASRFTSVMDWRGFRDVEYEGVVYGQKDREMPRFMDLPRHTSQPLQMAVTGVDPACLAEQGWEVIPGWIASRTLDSYRDFIQGSRAEFGVAKHGYALSRGGWFSDRSVCYLASGRPVLVQETGVSDCLPTGEGIVTFTDKKTALLGIERINTEYDRHRRAARRLAEECFATDRVLPSLLERSLG